jgi:hypothetical protein
MVLFGLMRSRVSPGGQDSDSGSVDSADGSSSCGGGFRNSGTQTTPVRVGTEPLGNSCPVAPGPGTSGYESRCAPVRSTQPGK